MEKSTIVGHRKGSGIALNPNALGWAPWGLFIECSTVCGSKKHIQASLHKGTCFTMNIKGGVTVKATCCTILGA